MAKNPDCNGCFYQEVDPRDGPCNSCFATAKYVHRDVFKDVSDSPVFKQTGKLSFEFDPVKGLRKTFGKQDYDTVNRPRHYMLFAAAELHKKEGIEVRGVIEKLVNKIREGHGIPFWKGAPLFEADYVQMMQYGMRFMDKNGKEDLLKMRWYLDKMIAAYE